MVIAVRGSEVEEEEGTRYDAHGTNHLTAAAGQIIAPPVYGSELIGNSDFETRTADNFGTWSENVVGDGTVTAETTDIHGGLSAVKITAGTTGNTSNIAQAFAVTAGATSSDNSLVEDFDANCYKEKNESLVFDELCPPSFSDLEMKLQGESCESSAYLDSRSLSTSSGF